uniref:Uncharacterized protein n=1 Tax=Panagrolaimus sp. JU765 TaxID=591449 RepID=A0AC34Q709_9BILA
LFTLWLFFYTDHPETHRSVSVVEIEKIHRDKTEGHKNMDTFVPYWEICKNPIILIVWLNALTDIVSAMFLVTYIPTYLNKVLNYNIAHAGLLGALPGLVHIPFKTTCGYLSDKIKTFDEKPKMVFFNTLALGVTAAMYATMGYLPIQYPILAVLVLTLIKAFIGATCGGFYKCGLLVSRQYSAFVIANIQFIKCLSLFIAPALHNFFIVDESQRDQWQNIFFTLAVSLTLSNILFCFIATTKPAEFTKITRQSSKDLKMFQKCGMP